MSRSDILIVDDQPDSIDDSIRLAIGPDDATLVVRHPRDILVDDLANCALIAVDHYLEEGWPELDSYLPAMSPYDGFALAAVLRSQVPADTPGPAMTILTGQLQKLARTLPGPAAEHLIASQHDVEWVFSKSGVRIGDRLVELARSVETLRNIWSNAFDLDALSADWLSLGDVNWRGVALDHVFQTRPPINELGAESNGASVLRWFLQRILPYPTFLADIHWTATRLGTTASWLKDELLQNSDLSVQLQSCAYTGALSAFGGQRWWRAGLAAMVSNLTRGQPFDQQALREGVLTASSEAPEFLLVNHPVLVLDPDTLEATRVVDVEGAVQVGPDGWPVFADNAWVAREDVSGDTLLTNIVLDPSALSPRSE